ncbi:hypothetical protein WJX79_003453 [Trebouxia sp. C0005]
MVVDLEHILLIDEPLFVPVVGRSPCDGSVLSPSKVAILQALAASTTSRQGRPLLEWPNLRVHEAPTQRQG